jgi:DNA uptake protein ComE-like DNA-binding protein
MAAPFTPEWEKSLKDRGLNPARVRRKAQQLMQGGPAPGRAPTSSGPQRSLTRGTRPEEGEKPDRTTPDGIQNSQQELADRLARIASSDLPDADKRKEYDQLGVNERYANAVLRVMRAQEPPAEEELQPWEKWVEDFQGSTDPTVMAAYTRLAKKAQTRVGSRMADAARELQGAELELQQARVDAPKDDPWYIDILNKVDKPRAVIVGGFSQLGNAIDPEKDASWDSFADIVANNTPTAELIEQGMMPAWARTVLGFTVDVLLDPVTWLTAGGLGIAKTTGKAGAKAAAGVQRAATQATAKGLVDDAAEFSRVFDNIARYGGVSGLSQADKRIATRALQEVGQIGKKSDVLGGLYIRLPTKEGIRIPGSRAVITPIARGVTRGTSKIRSTQGFAKVAHPFSTKKRQYLVDFRNGTPVQRIEAMFALTSSNVARMKQSAFLANANLQLTDLLRRTSELQVNGEQLLRYIDAPGARGTEAIQAQIVANPQVKGLIDEWSDWWEFTRAEANRLVGRDDFLMKRDNYTFHTLLQLMDDTDLDGVQRTLRQGGRFTELPMQQKAEIVAGNKYRGEMLYGVDDALNPQRLSPEDQAIQILKNQGKLDDSTEVLFNKDLQYVARTYVHMVGQRIGGEVMLREMVERGVGMTAKQYRRLAAPFVTEREKIALNLRLYNASHNAQALSDMTGAPLQAAPMFDDLERLAYQAAGVSLGEVDVAAIRNGAMQIVDEMGERASQAQRLRTQLDDLLDEFADEEVRLELRAADEIGKARTMRGNAERFDMAAVGVSDSTAGLRLAIDDVEQQLTQVLRTLNIDSAKLRIVDDLIDNLDVAAREGGEAAANAADVLAPRVYKYTNRVQEFVDDTTSLAARREALAQQMDAVDSLRDASKAARQYIDQLDDIRAVRSTEEYLRREWLRIMRSKGTPAQRVARYEKLVNANGGVKAFPMTREYLEAFAGLQKSRDVIAKRIEGLRTEAEQIGRVAGNLAWQNASDDAALKGSLANRRALKAALKAGDDQEIAMRQSIDRFFRLADEEADADVRAILRLHAQADLGELDNPGQWDAFFTGKLADDEALIERIRVMATQNLVDVGPDFMMPARIARIMTEGSKLQNPSEIKGLLRVFDYLTNVFKSQAIMTPGFITRNVVGAAMNNWLGGVNIRSYKMFMQADRLYKGAIKAGSTPDEALAAISKRMTPQASEAYGGWLRIAPLVAGGQASSFAADVGSDAAALGARRGARTPYQIAKKGERTGIRNQTLTDNALSRRFFYLNTSSEYQVRGVMAFDEFMFKAGNMDSAIDRVYTYHFDYEDLSSLERNVLKRIIPFYVWGSRNLPLQIKGLFTKPKVALSYLKAKNNIEALSEDEQIVPAYFNRLLGIRLPWLSDQGNARYFMPDLPFRDLGLLRSPDKWTLNPVEMAGQLVDFREVAGMVNPVIKTPIETNVANQKIFTGAPFKDGAVSIPAGLTWLTPALRLLGQIEDGPDGPKTNEKVLYTLEQALPILGRLRRALPAEDDEAGNEKRMTFFLSTGLGIGFRTNTGREQSNELFRRAQDLDTTIRRIEARGYTVPSLDEVKGKARDKVRLDYDNDFATEASFVLQAANTLSAKQLAKLPGFGESGARWVELQRLAYGNFETLDDLVAVEGMTWGKLDEALLKMRDDPESWGQARAVPIDLNASGLDDLVDLPGVGEGTARKILAYRQRGGRFGSAADLRAAGLSRNQIEQIVAYLAEDARKRAAGVVGP